MRSLLAALLLCVSPAALAAEAWVSSNHIQVIDLDAGRVVGRIPLQEFIHDIAFTPDGKVAFVASSQGLRQVDAEGLRVLKQPLVGSVVAVAVSSDGQRIAALLKAPSSEALAARKAGETVPASSIVLLGADLLPLSMWDVPAQTRDVVFAADQRSVMALDASTGHLRTYGADGLQRSAIDVATSIPRAENGAPKAMFGTLELSQDGRVAAFNIASETEAAVVQVTIETGAVRHVTLGESRRLQGMAWDDDGALIVSAVSHVTRLEGAAVAPWKKTPVNFVDVAPLPGSRQEVAIAPTFSEERKSGAVAVLDADGSVLRTVELPDMSPFVVAVRP